MVPLLSLPHSVLGCYIAVWVHTERVDIYLHAGAQTHLTCAHTNGPTVTTWESGRNTWVNWHERHSIQSSLSPSSQIMTVTLYSLINLHNLSALGSLPRSLSSRAAMFVAEQALSAYDLKLGQLAFKQRKDWQSERVRERGVMWWRARRGGGRVLTDPLEKKIWRRSRATSPARRTQRGHCRHGNDRAVIARWGHTRHSIILSLTRWKHAARKAYMQADGRLTFN